MNNFFTKAGHNMKKILALATLSFLLSGSAQASVDRIDEVYETSAIEATDAIDGFGFNVNLNLNLDLNQAFDKLGQMINGPAECGAQMKALMEELAFKRHERGERYNIMIYNLRHNYTYSFEGNYKYETRQICGRPTGVWYFSRGSFENKGKLGWENWAFTGWFDRNGHFVSFN